MRRFAVVGGGLSGLATAWELSRLCGAGADITVFESRPRWGGLLLSLRQDGFLLEAAADSISLLKPEAAELAACLGLADEFIPLNASQAYIRVDGRFEAFSPVSVLAPPIDVDAFCNGSLLSASAADRLAAEPRVAAASDCDETVEAFTIRRLGEEFLDRVVGPLVNGIYGADATHLSVAATLPALVRLEQERGFVTATGRENVPRRSPFVTLRAGMQRLTDGLRAALTSAGVRLKASSPVEAVSPCHDQWGVALPSGPPISVSGVAICTPASQAGRLLASADSKMSRLLAQWRYSPATVVAAAFEGELPLPADCTGFLVPRSAEGPVMACSWTSNKFAGRSPGNRHLVRFFLRPGQRSARSADAVALTKQACLEFGFGEPVVTRCFHWSSGLPCYEPGHQERVRALEQACGRHSGLELVGNYFDGVGLSDCIRRARPAAERLAGGPS